MSGTQDVLAGTFLEGVTNVEVLPGRLSEKD